MDEMTIKTSIRATILSLSDAPEWSLRENEYYVCFIVKVYIFSERLCYFFLGSSCYFFFCSRNRDEGGENERRKLGE